MSATGAWSSGPTRRTNPAANNTTTVRLSPLWMMPVRKALVPPGDGHEVKDAEQCGQERADDADTDEAHGPGGEHVGFPGLVGHHVEHEAGRPRTDRDGHEDRVEGVPVGACGHGHRLFAREAVYGRPVVGRGQPR